jgi:excinuclease ABC subunit B
MANVIARAGRPAIVFAPNKTLAAQLYAEFREFFPQNAVEYFVSYYDYYQPEAYVPQRDLFIEKDSSINEHIEQMRLSCTKSLMERRDVVIVATVSAIYGIGNPNEYHKMILTLRAKDKVAQRDVIARLIQMQYTRNEMDFGARHLPRARRHHRHLPGRARGTGDPRRDVRRRDRIAAAVRSADRPVRQKIPRFTVYPGSHYVTPPRHRAEGGRLDQGRAARPARRIPQAGQADRRAAPRAAHPLRPRDAGRIGFTKGIENYSRHLSGSMPGEPPPTLVDYLPKDALMFMDESHVMIGQLNAMYNGDRSRKTNLVDYGFRLPSALDNRPLKFDGIRGKMRQCVRLGHAGRLRKGRTPTTWSSRWCARPAWSTRR